MPVNTVHLEDVSDVSDLSDTKKKTPQQRQALQPANIVITVNL